MPLTTCVPPILSDRRLCTLAWILTPSPPPLPLGISSRIYNLSFLFLAQAHRTSSTPARYCNTPQVRKAWALPFPSHLPGHGYQKGAEMLKTRFVGKLSNTDSPLGMDTMNIPPFNESTLVFSTCHMLPRSVTIQTSSRHIQEGRFQGHGSHGILLNAERAVKHPPIPSYGVIMRPICKYTAGKTRVSGMIPQKDMWTVVRRMEG